MKTSVHSYMNTHMACVRVHTTYTYISHMQGEQPPIKVSNIDKDIHPCRAYIHAYILAYVCVCVYVYIYILTHTHTHTYIYILTHYACRKSKLPPR